MMRHVLAGLVAMLLAGCGDDGGGGCTVGGCSVQLCVESSAGPIVSTCEFLPEYACYANATCERQGTGECAWTSTLELQACLENPNGDGGGGPLQWYAGCGGPVCSNEPTDNPNVDDCTAQQQAGVSCTTRGAQCDTNACGTLLTCTDSSPTDICPSSRARHKTDIQYLDGQALEALHDQVLQMPLASYQYKTDASGEQQLGFIIEDVEPSGAVRGDRVNLYGYLSMAVAAIQVQSRQIEALHQQLTTLRAELDPAPMCEPSSNDDAR